jgi:hypothetical protein
MPHSDRGLFGQLLGTPQLLVAVSRKRNIHCGATHDQQGRDCTGRRISPKGQWILAAVKRGGTTGIRIINQLHPDRGEGMLVRDSRALPRRISVWDIYAGGFARYACCTIEEAVGKRVAGYPASRLISAVPPGRSFRFGCRFASGRKPELRSHPQAGKPVFPAYN